MANHPFDKIARFTAICSLATLFFLCPAVLGQNLAGKAIALSGTDFVRSTLWSNEMFPDENFTFELWFNADSPGVLVNESDTADVTQWDIAFAEIFPNGVIKAGAPNLPTVTLGSVPFGTWQHLTITYNQTNQTLSAYLNGQLQATSVGDRRRPADISRTAVYPLGRGGARNLGGGNFFTGKFDEVRIWNIALPASQIAAQWNRAIVPGIPGLMGYWHFDTTTGNLSPDASGKNNPALYVPVNQMTPLVTSTIPVGNPPAAIATKPAQIESTENVLLVGEANPNGTALSVHFEWGTTTAYGTVTPSQNVGSGTTVVSFSAPLTNLPPGNYHFRAVGVSGNETIAGADQSFTIVTFAGSAAVLNGQNYLRTTKWSHDLFQNEDFTFEFWFNAVSPGILLNEADTADTSLWDYAFAEVFPNGIIKAGVPGVPTFTVGTVEFGQWHHLALVYNQTAKTMFAYLDGRPAGSSAGDRTRPAEINRTSVYTFGRGGPTNLGGGNWFTGRLDEIRIWNQALSAPEILSGFDKKIGETFPTLVANWHLDTASGNTSPDASGKNNPAMHVPVASALTLAPSTAPIVEDRRPYILEQSVLNLNALAVELKGNVNARGLPTTVFFEYGLDAFTSRTPLQNIGQATVPVKFSSFLENLTPGSSYLLRLVASNEFGIVIGGTTSFAKTGWAGYALQLSTNDYIRASTDQRIILTNETFTVELWFKPTKAGVILSEYNPQNPAALDRSLLEILPSGSVEAGVNGLQPISVGRANFNEWNHIALRYDKASLKLDAILNGTRSIPSIGDRVSPEELGLAGFFAFGKSSRVKLGTGDFLGGIIEEIRIWKVARSDHEIIADHTRLLSGLEPGLAAYWRLEERDTNTIFDYSRAGNPGQNIGAERVFSDAPLVSDFAPIRVKNPGTIQLQFVVIPEAYYRLEVTEDFNVWTLVSTHLVPASGAITLELPQERSKNQFYRFVRQ